jgi:hypothetical protein
MNMKLNKEERHWQTKTSPHSAPRTGTRRNNALALVQSESLFSDEEFCADSFARRYGEKSFW